MLWKRAAWAVVDTILPPRCPGCGQIVQDEVGFCSDCWAGLHFLDGPACARCDRPMPQAVASGMLCGACIQTPPPYDRVVAPLAYGPAARNLVMRFKYGRKVATAAFLARLMVPALQRLLEQLPLSPLSPLANGAEHDCARNVGDAGDAALPLLVPVPLHRWRLWSRGFNQAAVLSGHLARLTGLPVAVDALIRTRSTGSMRGQGRKARARQVSGAFAMNPRWQSGIAGRHVILVDDVFTTGATAAACASVLLAGGARRVSVVAFARTFDDDGARAARAALTATDARPISG